MHSSKVKDYVIRRRSKRQILYRLPHVAIHETTLPSLPIPHRALPLLDGRIFLNLFQIRHVVQLFRIHNIQIPHQSLLVLLLNQIRQMCTDEAGTACNYVIHKFYLFCSTTAFSKNSVNLSASATASNPAFLKSSSRPRL